MYDDSSEVRRQRSKNKKLDITLMTLLASEATKDSLRLLKNHGRPTAKNHEDLEQKLNQLYSATNDKAGLEIELANIHPHKKWLFRTLQEIKNEGPGAGTAETKLQDIQQEVKSGFDGDKKQEQCNCPRCSQRYSNCCGMGFSGFDGAGVVSQAKQIVTDPMNLIALIAVVGLTYYFIKK